MSRNEKVFLKKDSGSLSHLKYGPLTRAHHNNRIICEAQNNEQVAPEADIQIQMISMLLSSYSVDEIKDILSRKSLSHSNTLLSTFSTFSQFVIL